MRRGRAAVVATVVLAVVVALGAVALLRWFRTDDTGDLGSLRGVCDGDTRGSAPAYAGPPPHPTVVFLSDGQGDYRDPVPFLFTNASKEIETDSLRARAWDPDTTTDVQLVACGEFVGSQATNERCTYNIDIEVPVDLARYEVSVYEVRTHRQIGPTVTMEGREKSACPHAIDPHDVPDRIPGGIRNDDLTRTLGRVVGNPQG